MKTAALFADASRLTDLAQQIQALARRVEHLEQRVARGTVDEWDRALAGVIAASTGGRAFTAVDLLRHAHVDTRLSTALQACGIASARHCGKWLQRVERVALADLRIVRCGTTRDGLLWCARSRV